MGTWLRWLRQPKGSWWTLASCQGVALSGLMCGVIWVRPAHSGPGEMRPRCQTAHRRGVEGGRVRCQGRRWRIIFLLKPKVEGKPVTSKSLFFFFVSIELFIMSLFLQGLRHCKWP